MWSRMCDGGGGESRGGRRSSKEQEEQRKMGGEGEELSRGGWQRDEDPAPWSQLAAWWGCGIGSLQGQE